jgi:hypothetical protein
MKRVTRVKLLLNFIILIICFGRIAGARPSSQLETPPPNEPKTQIPAGGSAAIESYLEWLQSIGARPGSSDNDQSFFEGFANFEQSLMYIDQLNSNPENSQWTAGLNSKANLPFTQQYPLMSVPFDIELPDSTPIEPGKPPFAYQGPPAMNWVAANKTTSIKTQGSCGNCWAFSTIATIESKLMILGGPATDLSEQYLVNCDAGSKGCQGGYLKSAFTFIQNNGGVPLESAVPNQDNEGTCHKKPSSVKISGWSETAAYSASAIMLAVMQSPVAFIFDTTLDFMYYKSELPPSSRN